MSVKKGDIFWLFNLKYGIRTQYNSCSPTFTGYLLKHGAAWIHGYHLKTGTLPSNRENSTEAPFTRVITQSQMGKPHAAKNYRKYESAAASSPLLGGTVRNLLRSG